jgi:hypothetical protein
VLAPLLLLTAVLLAGGETPTPPPPLLPPHDPVHAPLPAGLRVAFDPLMRPPRLGEAVRLILCVTAGSAPADLLWDNGHPLMSRRLTAPDGSVAEELADGQHRYGWDGVTRLQPGASVQVPVLVRIGRMPARPGRHTFSVWLDLGWGAERPGDPRRVSIDLDWVEPQPADIQGIIDAQFAASEDAGVADHSALAHPLFSIALTRRALAGSYRALQVVGETPGPEAATGLVAVAQRMPGQWTDLRDGETPNIAFCLFSRLAEHLPPRKLMTEECWWEDPASIWRRQTMAGVPVELLSQARSAALPWIGRADWGVAEVLTWAARSEDRPRLLTAIASLAGADPPETNALHTLWRYAYAALLAAPEVPPPDPEAGIAEAMLWACHRRNIPAPWNGVDESRFRALLASTDPLRRRIGLWGLPRPLPSAMIPRVVELMRSGAGETREVARDAIWTAHTTADPRIWDAMLENARDPAVHEDHVIAPVLVSANRRVELAQAVAARCRSDGRRGDDSFRTFSAMCLGVRPIFLYGQENPTLPTVEQWVAAAERWQKWLAVHGPTIATTGPLPPGDVRQPDYLLWPTWWFEAADSRRFFKPGPTL